MKRLLLVAALAAGSALFPAPAPAARRPGNHTLPNCPTSPVSVFMEYKPESYTDDGGHTYGPAATLTCDPQSYNRLHIKWVPGTWTLAQAQAYCAASGSYIQGVFAATSHVCVDVDF